MKILGTLLLFAALMVSSAFAQDESTKPYRYGGVLINGREWMRISEDARAFYVIGVSEATIQSNDEILHCKCTFGEISKGITNFYAEPAYRSLPVLSAWRLFVMKAKGVSQESIDKERSRLLFSASLLDK